MEKINIIQIGICHEHAPGKFASLIKRSDIFNIIGFVDERDFCKTPYYPRALPQKIYDGYKAMSLEEALNYPGLDAVTVEVPNNDLVPIALQCAERGIAMHMDKPAGEDLNLYKKLLDKCSEQKLPFQMGYMFRGNPAFNFCIRAIREKLIGEVFEITADMNHCYGNEFYNEYLGKFSGGIMYNLGCHLIDFVTAAMGRPDNVTAFLKSAPGFPEHIRNNCLAVLEYPHAIVTLRACSKEVANTGGRCIRIAGSCGTIKFSPVERFDGEAVEVELILNRDSAGYPRGNHTLRFPPQSDRYEVQLAELAGMIRGECKSAWSFEHDYLVHEVTLAAAGYTAWK